MRNSIVQNTLHHHQCLLAPTVIVAERSCIAGDTNSLFPPQPPTCSIRKSPLYTKYRPNFPKIRSPNNRLIPRAVLAATDSPSEQLAEKYKLEENTELQINVVAPGSGSLSQLEVQVTNSSDNLVFHWGGLRENNGKWVLPARQPQGTKNYKNRALRTPFTKSGPNSFLRIEIDDHAIQAIEFLIFDETQNKWFKHNGDNFHVNLFLDRKPISNVSVPEDLVQIQAYLRWEKNGKQMYTPEKEKVSEKFCFIL
jgi:alpha-glucan,water dikinase